MQLSKMVLSFLLLVSGFLFAGMQAFADGIPQKVDMPHVKYTSLSSDSSILKDVYVKLYLARLRRASLAIEREKEELGVTMKKRERAEILYNKNALSAEELEERRRDVEVASIRVQEAQAQAEEAETFVDIAVSRISIGLEMPICAELR